MFVTVYVPALLLARSISPVLVFTKARPDGVAEKVPAIAGATNFGIGLVANFLQNSVPSYVKVATGFAFTLRVNPYEALLTQPPAVFTVRVPV